jgi:hypothetical protein
MIKYSTILITICFLFSGCGSRQSLFDVSAKTEFRVELGLSIIESHYFVKDNVAVPLSVTMNNIGLKKDDVAEIVPLTATLRPKFSDEINLDFIQAVNIYIINQNDLRKKEIFYMDFVQGGTKTEIQLLPTLIDITDLVINDKAIIEIKIELRQFPPSSFDMSLFMEFSGFATK